MTSQHGRHRPLHAVLLIGSGAIALFLAAPAGSAWEVGAWFVPSVVATGVLVALLRRAPRGSRRPLGLLLAGQAGLLATSLVWYLAPVALGRRLPFPSPVDAAFLTVYGVFAAFLGMLVCRHGCTAHIRATRITLIDSLLFTVSASAALWVVALRPQLALSTSALASAVVLGYVTTTLLLFALVTRLLMTPGAPTVPVLLLFVWVATKVGCAVFYGSASAHGAFRHEGSMMVGWMVSSLALGAFAAHWRTPALFPDGPGGEPSEPGRARTTDLLAPVWGRLRLVGLFAAAVIPLLLDSMDPYDSDVLLVVAAASFALVLYRLSLVAGDLGEQRRLAEELQAAVSRLGSQQHDLARYAEILASTDDPVIVLTLDGVITDWNPGAERLYGYSREEAVGNLATMVLGMNDPDLVADALVEVLAEGHASTESVDRRKDGSTLPTSIRLSAICSEPETLLGVVVIARDMTEHRRREAEAHQESKLEALGRLSAGLAHEINSPIQFVGDNARFLAEAYQELIAVVTFYRGLLDTASPISWAERQEKVREAEAGIDFDYLEEEIPSAVAQTLEGIDRVSTIVRAMKTFSHPGHKEQVHADLNEALAATLTVTRHQVKEVAELDIELGALPPVRCDIAELNQVFLNLIVNAADAIRDSNRRGVIHVTTGLDGDEAVIAIRDSGGGIPDEIRSKIFDPFFTTKEVGRGTGQGLPLARAVVHEGHGGQLTVESVPGVGSTFTVRLPVEGRVVGELAATRS